MSYLITGIGSAWATDGGSITIEKTRMRAGLVIVCLPASCMACILASGERTSVDEATGEPGARCVAVESALSAAHHEMWRRAGEVRYVSEARYWAGVTIGGVFTVATNRKAQTCRWLRQPRRCDLMYDSERRPLRETHLDP
jgi:Fe-S cluster biogenesis protein NfuA